MSILYVDCFSGIAGDMLLAALLDAGLPVEVLNQQFEKLPLSEKITLSTKRVRKGALDANQLVIQILDQAVEVGQTSNDDNSHAHDHTHEHEHNQSEHAHTHDHEHPEHAHTHDHEHAAHSHDHDHEHTEQPNEHVQPHEHHHRGLADILAIIEKSELPPKAAQIASQIFTRLAEVEAKVHGETIETVHFHEVGALDSIIDILGVSIGLDYFKIDKVYASALPFSTGTVKTDHGLMPVPAPATLGLIESAHMPLRPAPDAGEMITPTGAAILAVLATFQRPAMRVTKVGVGAGTKDFGWPNILRVIIGDEDLDPSQPMVQISCNIDDMNPEFFAPVMEHLFTEGALDVYLTPIQMKKNRPATMISVIAPQALEKNLSEIILRETTSFGVRVQPIHRYEAERTLITLNMDLGTVRLKQKWFNGEYLGSYPEFEDCKRLASQHGLSVMQVYQKAQLLAERSQD